MTHSFATKILDSNGQPISTANPLIVLTTSNIYTLRLDEADSSTVYVGEAITGSATSGAVWRIKRILTSGTVLSILFADGNTNFDNVWDNRGSLSYS